LKFGTGSASNNVNQITANGNLGNIQNGNSNTNCNQNHNNMTAQSIRRSSNFVKHLHMMQNAAKNQ
jgi:hypothetical protein